MAVKTPEEVCFGVPPSALWRIIPRELADLLTQIQSLAGSGSIKAYVAAPADLDALTLVDGDYAAVLATEADGGGVYLRTAGVWALVAALPAILTESLAAQQAIEAAERAERVAETLDDLASLDALAQSAIDAEAAAVIARDQAIAAGAAAGTYPTKAEGLAAVAEGGYFWSPEGATAGYLQLYKDVSGVATLQAGIAQPLGAAFDAASKAPAVVGRPAAEALVTGTANSSTTTFIFRAPLDADWSAVSFDVWAMDSVERGIYFKRFAADGTLLTGLSVIQIPAGPGLRNISLSGLSGNAGEYLGFYVGAGTIAIVAGGELDSGGLWNPSGNVSSFDPATATTTTSQAQVRFNIVKTVLTGEAFAEVSAASADHEKRLKAAEEVIVTLDKTQQIRVLNTQLDGLRSGAPVAFEANIAAQAVQAACIAASVPMNARRLNRLSRFFDRLDAVGISVENLPGLWFMNDLVGDTGTMGLDRSKINVMQPGAYDLVVHGAPTYTPFTGVSYPTNADYLDTQLPIGALDPAKLGCGLIVNAKNGQSAGNSNSAYDMGVRWDSSRTLGMTATVTGTAGVYAAGGPTVARTTAQSGYLDGRRAMSVRRVSAEAFAICKFGRPVGGSAIGLNGGAAFAPSSDAEAAKTIFLGKLNIGTAGTPTANKHQAWYVSNGLTEAQEIELSAALYDLMMSVWWGDILIYDKGVGPRSVRKDVIVHGLSPMAVLHAYQCARNGLSVALVGAWSDFTVWDVGMTRTPFTDLKSLPGAYGLYWQALKWMMVNIHGQSNPVRSQYTLSAEPRAWSSMMRHLLDPTRADTYLPGVDVEVFMTGGISKVTRDDATITSLATLDGRTFFGRVFVQGDYDGDLVYHSGVPFTTGQEAAGSGGDSIGGFSTLAKRPVSGAASGNAAIDISIYRIAGDASSGLLPDIINLPSKSNGAACIALQSLNFRETSVHADKTRWAPRDVSAPPNYDASRYETVGRWYAAQSAAFPTLPMVTTDVIARGNLAVSNSAIQDLNNQGTGAVSLDLGNSGKDYAVAGIDLAARRGVWEDLRDRQRGWWFWHNYSGDTRIQPAIQADLLTYWLDPLQYLDPGPFAVMHLPNAPYIREPIFMASNAGFKLTGDDVVKADGSVPRSVKTISQINYSRDRHAMYVAGDSGLLASFGGFGTGQGGTDLITPWPLEVSLPDKSTCENLVLLTAPSMTKVAYSAARMEPAMIMAAEALAHAVKLAVKGNVAMQDVDYPTLRAGIQGAGYETYPPLPQVN